MLLFAPASSQQTAGERNADNGSFIILTILNIILCISSWKILKEPLANQMTSLANGTRAPEKSDVYEALTMFQPLKSRFWRISLAFIPWIILETILIARFFDSNSIFLLAGSLSITAIIEFFAARLYLERLSRALKDIWDSNIISARNTESSENVQGGSSTQISLEKSYASFILDLENYLNHWSQYACGLLFSTIFFLGPTLWLKVNNASASDYRLEIIYYVVQCFSYFFLGVLAWRLWAVSQTISGLNKRFKLVPKLGHPDKSGGFSPLGKLCLWSAFFVGVWGILLSAWVIVAQMRPQEDIPLMYISLAYAFLIVVLFISLLLFIAPLWSIHILMLNRQSEIKRMLWDIGANIDRMESELLQNMASIEPSESEKIIKRRDLLKDKYEEMRSYPVWPFDTSVIKKLIITETMPILTLTGVAEPIANVVKIALETLNIR